MDAEEFQKQFTICAYISYDILMKKLEEKKQIWTGERIQKPKIGSKIASGAVCVASGNYT
jgi:hypothetical protein